MKRQDLFQKMKGKQDAALVKQYQDLGVERKQLEKNAEILKQILKKKQSGFSPQDRQIYSNLKAGR